MRNKATRVSFVAVTVFMKNADPMTSLPSLGELVDALPEVYQPIYGHPEFDSRVKRNVEDRLASILAVHDALAAYFGRPVRILDLGCAQGWFAFNLAKAGAHVVGLDIIAANINVCNMLLLENRALQARFKLFEAEKVPDVVPEGQFDLVMGLSVLHHLCYHNGKEAVRLFTEKLFSKIPSGIFEFALASEPTELAPAQPEDPEFLINHVPFFRILSRHPSHLSSVQRPLYFCSRDFWYFGKEVRKFESWEKAGDTRRFFKGGRLVARLFRTDGTAGNENRQALLQAADSLNSAVVQSGEAHDMAWLIHEKTAD